MDELEVIDLTMPIRRHWRWFARPMLKDTFEDGDAFRHTYMTLNMHGFTHADGPNHFLPDGVDIASAPLARYYGEAILVDLTHIGENQAVTADDLDQRGADIRAGDIVLLRTDWPEKRDWQSMEFWGEAPYTDVSACEWLIDRAVKLVGYDYPPDYPLRYQVTDPLRLQTVEREDYTTHYHFFPAGIAVIEYLINLKSITQQRFQFFALPCLFEGSDGSPVRAIAIQKGDGNERAA